MSNTYVPRQVMVRKSRFVLTAWMIAGVFGAALSGCSESLPKGPPRAQVAGTVTYKGNPLPFGNIVFVPEPGSQLPVSGSKIVNGKYEVTQNGGVPFGKHRVEINGWSVPREETDIENAGKIKDPLVIPNKYNSDSELTFSVESSGAVNKDFELK